MASRADAAPTEAPTPYGRSHDVPARIRHYAERVSQRLRILKFTVWIAAAISGSFVILQFFAGPALWWLGVVNLAAATAFVLTPMLYRYGELVAPLAFTAIAYATTFVGCWTVGTDSGLQFYFLAAASIMIMILGVEHIALAAVMTGLGAGLAIALQFLVPGDTGAQPDWLLTAGFTVVIITACFMVVATVWYAGREITRAESAMEAEYERSESLLVNILPASIADRLKDPTVDIIADSYDDASILFADIADFTRRASHIEPRALVGFLNRLYTDLDGLVDRRGLEKVKTSGDSYMVVSGVPNPRPDHLEALARLALDIADTVAALSKQLGRPVPLRIGLATGPVVAGVVGARRFFYDVWGDAVNLAARMESTDSEGRIQVPQDVYERLKGDFVLKERGDVEVKGKGVMHTWYLVGERPPAGDGRPPQQLSATGSH